MENHELNAAHRATLFSALLELDHQQGGWDKVFQLLSQGRRVAEQAQLPELVEQLEHGQAVVLEGLQKTGQFLPWELKLIELGLATGNIRSSYQRIRDHYLLQQQLTIQMQRQFKMPLGLLAVVLLALLLWQFDQHAISLAGAVLRVGLIAVGFYGLWLMACRMLRSFFQYRHLRWVKCFSPLTKAVSLARRYHFLANISQGIDAGLSLSPALKLAADATPNDDANVFFAIYNEVEQGGRLSQALLNNGILDGVQLEPLVGSATASDAQAHITESVYHAYIQQLWFCTNSLPLLVYVMLPLLCWLLVVAA